MYYVISWDVLITIISAMPEMLETPPSHIAQFDRYYGKTFAKIIVSCSNTFGGTQHWHFSGIVWRGDGK